MKTKSASQVRVYVRRARLYWLVGFNGWRTKYGRDFHKGMTAAKLTKILHEQHPTAKLVIVSRQPL